MPNKNLFLKVLFILFFLKVFNSQAQTVKSGEITWKYLSEEKYEINLTLFKLCTGLDFDTIQKIEILSLDSFVKDSFELTFYRKSVQSISYLCDTVKTSCDTSLGDRFKVTEKHVFSQILDFNVGQMKQWLDSGACLFRFYYKNYERDFHSTLDTAYRNSTFEVDAEINYCGIKSSYQAVSDNSPNYTNPPLLLNYCNIPFENHDGGFDKDKDSIVYSLEAPLWNKYSEVGYIVNLSKNIPLSNYCRGPNQLGQCIPRPNRSSPEGFYFNTKTGEYIYLPTVCNQKGVLVVKASQYKLDSSGHRWIYTGFVKREISITTIISGNNNIPRLASSYTYIMCEGEKKCFKINVEDEEFNGTSGKQVWIDTISLSWNNIFKNATLTTDSHFMTNDNGVIYTNTDATLCIQTEIGDASPVPYYLSITARDKWCPSNAVTTKAIELYVNPYPKAKLLLEEKTCGKFSLKIDTQKPFPYRDTIKVQWLVLDSLNNTIAQGTTLQDSFVLPDLGRYYVQFDAKYAMSTCSISTIDTIFGKVDSAKWNYIVPRLLVSSDTLQCFKNHRFEMMDSSSVLGGGFAQRYWVIADKDTVLDQNLSLVFDTIGKYKAKLFLMSNTGCEYSDSLYLNLRGTRIDSVHFVDTAMCFRNNLFTGKIYSNDSHSIAYSWNFSDNADRIYNGKEINKVFQSPGIYISQSIITDNDLCSDTFLQNLHVFAHPIASIKALSDLNQCSKNSLFKFADSSTIENGKIASNKWSFINKTLIDMDILEFGYSFPGMVKVYLEASSDKNCKSSDSINIEVFESPIYSQVLGDALVWLKDTVTYSCPNYIGHYYTWGFSETMGKGLSSGINVNSFRIQWLDTGWANVYCKFYKDPRCVDSSILSVYIQEKPEPVSTMDLDSRDLLFCFPNPVFEVLTMPEGYSFVRINIYDELGKLILQSQGTNQLSLKELLTGVYIVEGVLPNGNKVRNKVIKINP